MFSDEEVRQAFNEAVELGLIEAVGIGTDGEWLYALTELGRSLADYTAAVREAQRRTN